MVKEKSSNCDVQIAGKCIYELKKLEDDTFNHFPQAKLFPMFLLPPTGSVCLKIYERDYALFGDQII